MLYIVECSFQIDMETANGNNEAICLELLGVLRRCFMQQADVRLCLYEGKTVTVMEFNSSAATELVVFFPSLKWNMMQASVGTPTCHSVSNSNSISPHSSPPSVQFAVTHHSNALSLSFLSFCRTPSPLTAPNQVHFSHHSTSTKVFTLLATPTKPTN